MTDTPAPRWASRKVACKYSGVSDATFYRYVNAGIFIRHDIGHGLYDLDQIDEAIRSRASPRKPDAVRAALDTVRARIPTSRPLISVTAVHEILDEVAKEAGA